MSSSTSSSNRVAAPWRRFFATAAGTAAAVVAVLFLFAALVDPFDCLPLSPRLDRPPIAGNARFAFPALARSDKFDSALFGTSTSRLIRPVALNPLFGARFANLSMNDATAYEQARLMAIFAEAHPRARVVMVGLDVRWCVTGDTYERLTPRPFPAWLYESNPWRGYAELLNAHAIQTAGQMFGVLIGIKPEPYGRDGYTRFVPPDEEYDRARAATHLRTAGPNIPGGARDGAPSSWRFPTHELLLEQLGRFSEATTKILFFVPYHHALLPVPDSDGEAVWRECKRRIVMLADKIPGTVVVDFMLPSLVTNDDDNYWDPLHYRVAVADTLARDLAAAVAGRGGPNYRVLHSGR